MVPIRKPYGGYHSGWDQRRIREDETLMAIRKE